MALIYLDTSALVKLYVQELGTDVMLKLAHPDAENRLAILSLSRIEFREAVRRRAKLGDLEDQSAEQLISSFGDHLVGVYQIQPVNEAVLSAAAVVVDRHLLRAYDALQLAGCMTLQATASKESQLIFTCADENLIAAAKAEGLSVINPNISVAAGDP